jgi:hypothetical protein
MFAQTELGIIKRVLCALNPKVMSGNARWFCKAGFSLVEPGRIIGYQFFQEPVIALLSEGLIVFPYE